MKNKLFLFVAPVLAIAGLCTLSACKKDTPPNPGLIPIDYTVLPEATQEGKNTFGCLVDGEVWVPRVELFVPWYDKAVSFHERNGRGSGVISCRLLNNTNDDFFSIAFAPNYFHPATYLTTGDSLDLLWFNPDFSRGTEYFQHENKDTTNFLRITAIDTSLNFISGVFQCNLYNITKNKIIKITQGRFDMPYYPQ